MMGYCSGCWLHGWWFAICKLASPASLSRALFAVCADSESVSQLLFVVWYLGGEFGSESWLSVWVKQVYCSLRGLWYLCLYVVYIPALITCLYDCVLEPLNVYSSLAYGCKRECVLMRVCFSFSLRTSSPICLLCSVMGTQGGLRLAPRSVLIWLAFRYRSDSLPLTQRGTQIHPNTHTHLPSSILILFFLFPPFSASSLSFSVRHTHIFFPCLHLSFHTITRGRSKIRTNWYESQGKKPGGGEKTEK